MSFKILHLSPHLGGGVGRVVNSFLIEFKKNNNYFHEIYCLDTINENSKKLLKKEKINFKESISENISLLIKKIESIDILLIHWWNHPLLYEFLVKYELPKNRVVFWSHISGSYAPQIFSKTVFDYADKFIFTTPLSYDVEEVKNYEEDKFYDIWATSDFNQVKGFKKRIKDSFNIGYIGTLDFSKMYRRYIELNSKVDISNIKFITCGEGSDFNTLKKQVKVMNLEEKFIFPGFVENIKDYLENFDLFAYPLCSEHYGTCDLSLIEAMYCGIVPIVFNNSMEKYIVKHMHTGIVVSSEEEYINSIKLLYNDFSLRDKLSKNAQEDVRKRFHLNSSIKKWEDLFTQILKKDKTQKKWTGKYFGENVKPYEIYLESLGKYSLIFEENNKNEIKQLVNSSSSWKSNTKGTVMHYASFFEDNKLKQWVSVVNGELK